MKVLSKDDLIVLLNSIDRNLWDSYQMDGLFEKYGDDWYIEGNGWAKTVENPYMAKLIEGVQDE